MRNNLQTPLIAMLICMMCLGYHSGRAQTIPGQVHLFDTSSSAYQVDAHMFFSRDTIMWFRIAEKEVQSSSYACIIFPQKEHLMIVSRTRPSPQPAQANEQRISRSAARVHQIRLRQIHSGRCVLVSLPEELNSKPIKFRVLHRPNGELWIRRPSKGR